MRPSCSGPADTRGLTWVDSSSRWTDLPQAPMAIDDDHARRFAYDLRGHDSHGVLRIPQYIDFLQLLDRVDRYRPRGRRRGRRRRLGPGPGPGPPRPSTWIHPGRRNSGCRPGLAKLLLHRLLGEYAERAVDEGLILIATVNNNGAGQRVAPPGGAGGSSTNPSPQSRRTLVLVVLDLVLACGGRGEGPSTI